ncbi:MAG: hypothetical protein U0Q47_11185 [Mycobacterium sp.]
MLTNRGPEPDRGTRITVTGEMLARVRVVVTAADPEMVALNSRTRR